VRPFIQRGSVTFEVDLDHVKLRSLHVQMDPFDRLRAGGIMDVWMSGQCVYAVILADSELLGRRGNWLNQRKGKAPDVLGLLGSFVLCMRTGETMRCARW
jgi:hypothetical protein